MKSRIIVAAALISFGGVTGFISSSKASYTCKQTLTQGVICEGTKAGQKYRSTSRTNLRGEKVIEGYLGGQRFSETCRQKLSGDVVCE